MRKFFLLLCVLSIFFKPLSAILPVFSAVGHTTAVLRATGEIVAAGTGKIDGKDTIVIAQYLSSGLLDAAFGVDGVVNTLIGLGVTVQSVCLQVDGKIVVAGTVNEGGILKFALVRYTVAGALDLTFNGTGIVTTELDGCASAQACSIQADGKIVVVGRVTIVGKTLAALIRYNADGTLDGTFGIGGIVTTQIGLFTLIDAVVIQPDGKIVIAGFAKIGGEFKIALARYLVDGTLDVTFGIGGIVTTLLGSSSRHSGLTLQDDGKIVVATSSDKNFAVVRLEVDGSLDLGFGIGGLVIIDDICNISAAFGIEVQADGDIVAAGFAGRRLVVIRLLTTGVLDATFGVGGIVQVLLGKISRGHTVLIQPDNKIVVAGLSLKGAIVARFNTDGTRDSTFGIEGLVSILSGTNVNLSGVTRILDVKAAGIAGGTFTSGSWITRVLNTIIGDISSVSISANQITLQPGIYQITAQAPAFGVGGHQIRLMNITEGIVEALGTNASSLLDLAGLLGSPTYSTLDHVVAIAQPTVFEIQHQGTLTKLLNGLGTALGFDTGVFTAVTITKRLAA